MNESPLKIHLSSEIYVAVKVFSIDTKGTIRHGSRIGMHNPRFDI